MEGDAGITRNKSECKLHAMESECDLHPGNELHIIAYIFYVADAFVWLRQKVKFWHNYTIFADYAYTGSEPRSRRSLLCDFI